MEDRLNAILGNQEAMSRIMALAKQLSGDSSPPPKAQGKPPMAEDPGALDPELLAKFMPLLRDLGRTNAQSAQLLYALRPYLKEERRDKVERAIKLAHVIHIAKRFLSEGGLEDV